MLYKNGVHLRMRLTAIMCVAVLLILSGCDTSSNMSSDDDKFGVYYLNSMQTAIVKRGYSLKSDTVSDSIEELIDALSDEELYDSNPAAIPEGIVISDYELADGALILHFNRDYQNLEATREVLLRSAVAKTMLQLNDVNSVSFYISDEPLKDASGNVIGQMTEESFLDTFGEQEEALDSDEFILYYASEDGQSLIKTERQIHFNSTMSPESVVLTYLSKNPEYNDKAKAVISSNTKVISVTTKEGVCYVKLDSSFLSQSENISTNTAVYGIVNSLTALDNVNKVEITVDSSADGTMPVTDTASGLYEADLSLVEN